MYGVNLRSDLVVFVTCKYQGLYDSYCNPKNERKTEIFNVDVDIFIRSYSAYSYKHSKH